MPDDISTNRFLSLLSMEVDSLGGQQKAADVWGVHYTAIGAAIRGERTPAPKILEAMGYTAVKDISYRYKKVQ